MSNTKKLLSSSLIVFVGTTIGSVFSCLFGVLVGRQLGPALYGELTALLSFIAIISVVGGAVLTIVMRYSGETYAVRHYKALRKLFTIFTKYVLALGIGIFLIGLIFLNPIAKFLSIETLSPIVIALASIIVAFTMTVNKGILQGTQKFMILSVLNALEMILRLGLGLLFVRLGYQLTGAIGGIVLATIIVYIYSLWPLQKMLVAKKEDGKSDEDFTFDKKEIIAYSLPTTITTLLLAVSLNADVILVKHFFAADQAGMYAAISTIAKVILYLTAPVLSVMFPMISEHRAKNEPHYKTFLLSLIMTLVGGLFVLMVYTVAPAKVIRILYGETYISFFSFLPSVGLMVLFFTLVNLMVSYFSAVRKFTFIWYYLFVLVLQIAATFLFHDSLIVVVRIFIAGQALLFVCLMGIYLYGKKSSIIEYFQKR